MYVRMLAWFAVTKFWICCVDLLMVYIIRMSQTLICNYNNKNGKHPVVSMFLHCVLDFCQYAGGVAYFWKQISPDCLFTLHKEACAFRIKFSTNLHMRDLVCVNPFSTPYSFFCLHKIVYCFVTSLLFKESKSTPKYWIDQYCRGELPGLEKNRERKSPLFTFHTSSFKSYSIEERFEKGSKT